MADPIGSINTIHGFNPKFAEEQDPPGRPRFCAFVINARRRRPERFLNQIVPGTRLLDHQGHIIAQNVYADRLNAIAESVTQEFKVDESFNLEAVAAFLVETYPSLGFEFVNSYIKDVLIAKGGAKDVDFIDYDKSNATERVEGYFSVLNWNPVNICRAPGDDHRIGDDGRKGYPGDKTDRQVIAKLLADPRNPGITLSPTYGEFIKDHGAQPEKAVDPFLLACNSALAVMPAGFYQFDWVEVERDFYKPGV